MFEHSFVVSSMEPLICGNLYVNPCKFRLIEVKDMFDESIVYFVYNKKSHKHYWAFYNPLNRMLCIWTKIYIDDGTIKSKRLKKRMMVDLSNAIKYNIYAPLLIKFHVYDTYMTVLPFNYIIYRCDKDWKEYCEELNKEINKNKNYFIKKISHMREITDLIGSFL